MEIGDLKTVTTDSLSQVRLFHPWEVSRDGTTHPLDPSSGNWSGPEYEGKLHFPSPNGWKEKNPNHSPVWDYKNDTSTKVNKNPSCRLSLSSNDITDNNMCRDIWWWVGTQPQEFLHSGVISSFPETKKGLNLGESCLRPSWGYDLPLPIIQPRHLPDPHPTGRGPDSQKHRSSHRRCSSKGEHLQITSVSEHKTRG